MKVILSIKPEFVEKIVSGVKKYEYRKSIFRRADVSVVVIPRCSGSQKQKGVTHVEEHMKKGAARGDKETVYLAGAVAGLSQEEAAGWRREAYERLSPYYRVYDPMRDKDVTREYDPEAIFCRDMLEVSWSDILLVEMDREQSPYIGTAMEIYAAYKNGARVILWGGANRGSYFLMHCTSARLDTLDGALDYLVRAAGGGDDRG